MGPIKAQAKMLLSRACQLASVKEMTTPLVVLDESFGVQVFEWVLALKDLVNLKPHKRALIRGKEHLSGLLAHTDGGKGGFGTVVFVSATEDKNSDALKNINMGSKSRVSRRTIPCH